MKVGVGEAQRRRAELGVHLGAGQGQVLSAPDEDGDPLPAPGPDLESQRGEGLDFRVGSNALLVAVAAELAADDLAGVEGGDRLQDLHLLVADRLAVGPGGGLHGQVGQDLEQVVLHDVADRAGFFVERAAALDAEVLGHGDLDALDVVAVPDRLEERVGEAEEEQVLHRPLAEIVVDPEDRLFVEVAQQDRVQLPRRREVPAERLLDDDPGAHVAVGPWPVARRPSRTSSVGSQGSGGDGGHRPSPCGGPETSPGSL